MKLFQIEEPDGSPSDPDAPGAAIGIDAAGVLAEIATAVGGNAVILADRPGFERTLPVPGVAAPTADWRELFEGARLRAERALARPVTHAVVVLTGDPDRDLAVRLHQAAITAGLDLLDIVAASALSAAVPVVEAAAVLAEDLAPRAEGG